MVAASELALEGGASPKVMAFVLPQFHRIPENDRWWGEGFTEWTNVRKALPLYPGHLQPRLPAHGRYYDMLDSAVHDWQADLALRHGLHGFCYYHYWFGGQQLLEKPVELLLRRGKPDIPFCLAWANESWTRAWDGGDSDVLMPQSYGDRADWGRHFEYLLNAFRDPRYVRVNGKPMFLIYRSSSIDVCGEMLALWQQLARSAGLPGLHVVSMLTGFDVDVRPGLFEAFAEFEPMYTIRYGLPYWQRKREKWINRINRAAWRVTGRVIQPLQSYDYASLWRAMAARGLPERHYGGAFLDWDNSPRRGLERSLIIRNFDGDAFVSGLQAQLRKASAAGSEFLFVNAWNEWAEGSYFEPDAARGTFFLEALRDAVSTIRQTKAAPVV
jgi:lipopolysaccharide biosynthesis protein